MCQFKIWDLVKYFSWTCTYRIIDIMNTNNSCRLESIKTWTIYPAALNAIKAVDDPDAPETFTHPINNNFMQYFHTAVLVSENNQTSASYNYKELVPYAVRTAKDSNDMRDTLVRELEKGIVTSDCKFLICPIF